ncbi:unnamed protein product [Phytophthora fragariaefolia]|uniref:Unnamed protein product n=1 Tax=Phytophthora fragariaefolia TaxID=1490495 RepID=A0A9W7D0Z0_9STRA|nr:unnamed protein product [Phytophthora fragariaefolia]
MRAEGGGMGARMEEGGEGEKQEKGEAMEEGEEVEDGEELEDGGASGKLKEARSFNSTPVCRAVGGVTLLVECTAGVPIHQRRGTA